VFLLRNEAAVCAKLSPNNVKSKLMRKNIKWQSRTPKFLKKAIIIGIFFKTPDGRLFISPCQKLLKKFDQVSPYVAEMKKVFDKKGGHQPVSDNVLTVEIKFDKLVPLKREYWQKSDVPENLLGKIRVFTNFYYYYNFYKLLITPSGLINGEDEFSVAIPLKIPSLDRDLELFLKSSDQVVDEEAKYAALYTPREPRGYNWVKKRLVEKTPPIFL